MATANIKAPDTTGTRAAKGQGRCNSTNPERAAEEALVRPVHSGGTDVGSDLRGQSMFGNLNMPFRFMFNKSNIVFPAEL
jgi:hypothetical protein